MRLDLFNARGGLGFDHQQGELLARVVLDDELLVELHGHLLTGRFGNHGSGQLGGVGITQSGTWAERMNSGRSESTCGCVACRGPRSGRPRSADSGTSSPVRSMKWPWVTTAAHRRGVAKPMRYTTLSRRISSMRSRFSPVMPSGAPHPGSSCELALDDRVAAPDPLLLAHLESVLAHLPPSGGFTGRRAAALERHFFE